MGRDWGRRLGGAVLALALGMASGCLRFVHPIDPPDKERLCAAPPLCCRNHVYVFLIHGCDPFDCANLSGVNDHLHALGFIKTYYGQMYHAPFFARELKRLHEADPEAHFALVGFSFGANLVRGMLDLAEENHIPIDLVVYLGGNTLSNPEDARPPHVARMLNILACGCIWNGDQLDGAENIQYDDCWHFGSPAHPHTLKLLDEALNAIASQVPVIEEVPPGGELPPRPELILPPTPGQQRGDWDFLRPESERLPPPRPEPQPSADGDRRGVRPPVGASVPAG
jgi:hypothetical protein